MTLAMNLYSLDGYGESKAGGSWEKEWETDCVRRRSQRSRKGGREDVVELEECCKGYESC